MSHNVCQCHRGLRSIWLRYKSATKHRNPSAIIRVQLQLLWPTIYAFVRIWAEMSKLSCFRSENSLRKILVSLRINSRPFFRFISTISIHRLWSMLSYCVLILSVPWAAFRRTKCQRKYKYSLIQRRSNHTLTTEAHIHSHTRAVKFNDVWQPSFIFPFLFDEQSKWANGFFSIFIDTFPHFHRNKSLEMDSRLACIHQTFALNFFVRTPLWVWNNNNNNKKEKKWPTANGSSCFTWFAAVVQMVASLQWTQNSDCLCSSVVCANETTVGAILPLRQRVCVYVCGCECATEFDTVVCVGLCVV